MTMIKGITVTLYEKEKINEDAFGKPIYKETPIKVKNVLVAPHEHIRNFGYAELNREKGSLHDRNTQRG